MLEFYSDWIFKLTPVGNSFHRSTSILTNAVILVGVFLQTVKGKMTEVYFLSCYAEPPFGDRGLGRKEREAS